MATMKKEKKKKKKKKDKKKRDKVKNKGRMKSEARSKREDIATEEFVAFPTNGDAVPDEQQVLAAGATKVESATMRVDDLEKFIVERHRTYLRKTVSEPKPWTHDAILQCHRFCNVYRELDTETIWIAQNWRVPHADDPDLWFALVVARFVNWHPTLSEIGYPVPWNPDHFIDVLEDRKARGEKRSFTPAYRVPSRKGMSRTEFLATRVFNPLWEHRDSVREINQGTLAQAHQILTRFDGLGSFLAGQVIADLKFVMPLRDAEDWATWAASGPGSERGLNRVLNRGVDQAWDEWGWSQGLRELRAAINPRLDGIMPELHAQDLQNCLCEFDKYERVRLGQGRPKQNYPGLPDKSNGETH